MNQLRSFTRTTLAAARLLGLATLTSTAALAGPLIIGGTDPAPGNFAVGVTAGYDFVSTVDQSVSALGLWDSFGDGFVAAYTVGLWETSTQTLLTTVTIDSSDVLDISVTVEGGKWRYETLAVPVALTSDTTYTVGWYSGAGHSETDALRLSQPTMTTAPTVTTGDAGRFRTGLGSLSFPVSTATGVFFAMPNVQLVPEPGSALLLLGGAGLLGLRRRRS